LLILLRPQLPGAAARATPADAGRRLEEAKIAALKRYPSSEIMVCASARCARFDPFGACRIRVSTNPELHWQSPVAAPAADQQQNLA
jgi:hypothetical protein